MDFCLVIEWSAKLDRFISYQTIFYIKQASLAPFNYQTICLLIEWHLNNGQKVHYLDAI
jgi:hypothetical protein